MDLTRRHFLFASVGALPLTACEARAVGPQFTPESFGAAGDGIRDDYHALQRMVDAVNGAGGGQIIFGPGRTYFVDRFVTASNGISDLTFTGCDGLSIDGNGATLSVKGDFHRDAKATRGLSGLLFEDCRNVSVRNIFLDGNVHRMTRLADLPEAPTHGLHFQSCLDVHVDGIEARRFAADGMYVRESKRTQLRIQDALKLAESVGLPAWVEVNASKMEGVFKKAPDRDEFGANINESLIVELYSR